MPFLVDRQVMVAAAGGDDHRRTERDFRRGRIDADAGLVNVEDAAVHIALAALLPDLFAWIRRRAGRAVRLELVDLRLGGGQRGGQSRQGKKA